MGIKRLPSLAFTALVLTTAFSLAQDAQTGMTDEEKIENAMSAGPDEITQDATILEWPTEPGGEFNVLREGTNGWSCIISSPGAVAKGQNNALCDDEVWLAWEHAFMEGRTPEIDRLGVSYSLSNTAEGSNTDPSAIGPTEDNEWHMMGPHIALLVPDPALFEGISTDPHNGGPYVMWAGTPYAHIMLPVEPYPED